MRIKEKEAKSILTKSPPHHGYTASPYSGCQHKCIYCYANYLAEWTGHEGEKWGDYVDIKNWKPFTEKQREQYKGKSVFISSATDPYQPIESEYKRTRKLLEELVGLDMNVLIVTKSALALRDWDLFKELNATVAFSINTLNESFRADMDNASTIEERIRSMKILHEKGIHTVCFISPIFPGITNVPIIIEEVAGKCDAVYLEHLVLNGTYKGPIMYYIKTRYPEYYDIYDKIFNKNELDLWWQFDDYMEEWAEENGYKYSYSKFPKEHREKPVVINYRGHKGR